MSKDSYKDMFGTDNPFNDLFGGIFNDSNTNKQKQNTEDILKKTEELLKEKKKKEEQQKEVETQKNQKECLYCHDSKRDIMTPTCPKCGRKI